MDKVDDCVQYIYIARSSICGSLTQSDSHTPTFIKAVHGHVISEPRFPPAVAFRWEEGAWGRAKQNCQRFVRANSLVLRLPVSLQATVLVSGAFATPPSGHAPPIKFKLTKVEPSWNETTVTSTLLLGLPFTYI